MTDADILIPYALLRYAGHDQATLHPAGRRIAEAVLAHESVTLPDGAPLPVAGPWATSTPAEAGWAQMGDVPALQALLDRLVALHRLAPGAENLWLTEQGYESNAELAEMPWSEPQQAQLDADSEYLAWRDPQVTSFSQFLLRDTRSGETLAASPTGMVRLAKLVRSSSVTFCG